MSRLSRLSLICRGMTGAGGAASFPGEEALAEGEAEAIAGLAYAPPKGAALVSAPEISALQTAVALFPSFDIDPAFRNLDYGRWAGEPVETVHAEEPDNLDLWRNDPDAAPHGGESLSALAARLRDWLEGNLAFAGRRLVVTHPAVIRASVVLALDAPIASFWRVDVEPLTVADFSSDGQRWVLRGFGRSLL